MRQIFPLHLPPSTWQRCSIPAGCKEGVEALLWIPSRGAGASPRAHCLPHTQELVVRGDTLWQSWFDHDGGSQPLHCLWQGERVSKRARLLAEAVGRWLGRTAQAHLCRVAPDASCGEGCTATAQTPVLERVRQEKEVHRLLMFIAVSPKSMSGVLVNPSSCPSRDHTHSLHSALGTLGCNTLPCMSAWRRCSRTGLDTPQNPCPPLQRWPLHTLESQKQGRARRSWVGSAEPQ